MKNEIGNTKNEIEHARKDNENMRIENYRMMQKIDQEFLLLQVKLLLW